MAPQPLLGKEIDDRLTDLPEWNNDGRSLSRDFSFASFAEAMRFVNQVAAVAEDHQHHPDIALHDFSHVSLLLTSHDAGGVTEKDISLAGEIDKLF